MNRFRLAFALASAIWVVALPLAAVTANPAFESTSAARAIAFVTYAIGSLLCHQRPERSFLLAGVQLPVCARCTGIYAGAALTSLFGLVRFGPGEERSLVGPTLARRLLLVGGAPAAATIVFEWATGQMPGHWIRALSGVPLGGVVAWIVIRSLERDPFRRIQCRPTDRKSM